MQKRSWEEEAGRVKISEDEEAGERQRGGDDTQLWKE